MLLYLTLVGVSVFRGSPTIRVIGIARARLLAGVAMIMFWVGKVEGSQI
jgi:hypothetical protein